MKRIVLLIACFMFIFGANIYAAKAYIAQDEKSENEIKVVVSDNRKLSVTGYTIKNGSNIIIYYVHVEDGANEDDISIDLSTVARPYKILLSEAGQNLDRLPFSDLSGNKYKDYIKSLHDLNYIDGYTEDNTFRPDNTISRGELFTLLSKMPEIKGGTDTKLSFEDLSEMHWAYNATKKIINSGLIEGYYENNKRYIKLNNNITIGETCKIINDVYKVRNNSVLNYDTRFVNHWAKNYVQNLLNEDIISAEDDFYKEGNLNRPITRGEVAMLLSRAIGR